MLLSYLRALWNLLRRRSDAEMDAEMAFHRDAYAADLERSGLSPAEARRRARAEFGNIDAAKEAARDLHPLRWLENLTRDVRLALRGLKRAPGFTVAIALTLGLGLGLNTAIAIWASGPVQRYLALRDQTTLVWLQLPGGNEINAESLTTPDELLRESGAFQEVLGEARLVTSLEGQTARGAAVSGDYFSMLAPPIVLGRPIHPDDEERVVVLGESYWRVRFGADPNIVGRSVRLGGSSFEVIGVVGAGFTGITYSSGLWVPLAAWNRLPDTAAEVRYLSLGARLQPGVTTEQAAVRVTAYAARATGQPPEPGSRAPAASVQAMADTISEGLKNAFFVLLWVFGLTMAIPCANAANLLLARALGRQREIGVRLAMGAGRFRIARQLLAEGFLLALLAASVGLAVAQGVIALALRVWYSTAPASDVAMTPIPPLGLNWVVVGYVLAAAILTTVAFAVLPALQSSRLNLVGVLHGEVGVVRASRLRGALAITQIALCTLFLASAAVLLRTTDRIVSADPGFDPHEVFQIGFADHETTRTVAAALENETWVDVMAFATGDPMHSSRIEVETEAGAAASLLPFNRVSPEYFPLLRLPIIRGSNFSREEAFSEADVVIVSETAAATLWPGDDDPIGKRILASTDFGKSWRPLTVIGLTRDAFKSLMMVGEQGIVYLPATIGSPAFRGGPMVRGQGTPEQVRQRLEAVLARTGAADRGARVESLQEVIERRTFMFHQLSWIASTLGAVALALTLSGIFAAASYLFGQRTRELGIRMALGATAADAARFILTYSMKLAALGLVVGTLLAAAAVSWIGSQVFLPPDAFVFGDWPAYALTGLVIALAALAAALVPALRAARLQPAATLRAE